jgi:hypothetical protein
VNKCTFTFKGKKIKIFLISWGQWYTPGVQLTQKVEAREYKLEISLSYTARPILPLNSKQKHETIYTL